MTIHDTSLTRRLLGRNLWRMVNLSPRKPRVKANLNLPEDVKQQAQALVEPLGVSLSQYVTKLVEADLAARGVTPSPEVRAA